MCALAISIICLGPKGRMFLLSGVVYGCYALHLVYSRLLEIQSPG